MIFQFLIRKHRFKKIPTMIRREKTMRRGSIRPGSKQNMYLVSPSPTKLPGMPFKLIH